jgi:hypothetical protein
MLSELDRRGPPKGHMGRHNISACSLSHRGRFCVMCCLIRRLLFFSLHKLSSTSSDGVRSGNLDVRLSLVAFLGGGQRMHSFSRALVFISLR